MTILGDDDICPRPAEQDMLSWESGVDGRDQQSHPNLHKTKYKCMFKSADLPSPVEHGKTS